MSVALALRDVSTSGDAPYEVVVEFSKARITARELIRSRVYKEVHDYNEQQPKVFRGLVVPTETEKVLNGRRPRKKQKIDWRGQYKAVLQGFEKQRYLLLVDDRQIESLREEIVITPQTKVTFFKLVPLVGG